ncbi:amidohydrolase [Kordiimonas aestuarii]|uniref:amidohydrolase n=1 Tax=Kordiimonas aestuarii TaxID=1005925 RepID=UPI0021D0305D|nr:amidohydrolase [Kordiimonas aestuarii]
MKKYLAGVALATLIGSGVSAADLKSDVAADYDYLEKLYIHLHQNPELSLQEGKTSARMAAELKKAGFDVTTNFGGHGVVAVMKNGDGPTVMIRADMDGLPVPEQTGLSYASKATMQNAAGETVPVMHACGHDVHMTSLIGTARRLAAMKDAWSGTLVMIAQPAEEQVKGAAAMLDEGLFTKFPKPDYNLSLHVSPDIKAGDIGMVSGYALANVDSADIEIHGVGGHGAYPHTTKDPVVLGAYIVTALQTLVARETSPFESGVVTVGSIHAGTKHNIISNRAHLQITIRSYSEDVRQNLKAGIERIARGQAIAFGLPEDLMPEVAFSEGTPSTYNNPELTARIYKALDEKLGDDRVYDGKPVMAAEDFSLFGRTEDKIPSLMLWLGATPAATMEAAEKGEAKAPGLHSPFFKPDREPTIKGGVEAMTQAALELLGK